MSDVFYTAHNYQQSSEPFLGVKVHEEALWPIADNSGSGTKDAIGDGLHPVLAIGGRTVADGRPRNVVGAMIAYEAGLTTATGMATLNISPGTIVRNYVANVLTYSQGDAATFETAPVVGQPVYVDDSDDLGEGVTLSMSPLNDADVANPMAGILFYCQDEYADAVAGGANSTSTFDTSLADELVEQTFCVLLWPSGNFYEAPA